MILIDKNNFDPQLIIPKLKEKTNMFDYETEESYTRRIKEGSFIIFLTDYSIFPCEFALYPSGLRTLEVNTVKLIEGEDGVQHAKDTLKKIEDYAKSVGIDRVVLEGRYGWLRIFPDYEIEQITLFKNIKELTKC